MLQHPNSASAVPVFVLEDSEEAILEEMLEKSINPVPTKKNPPSSLFEDLNSKDLVEILREEVAVLRSEMQTREERDSKRIQILQEQIKMLLDRYGTMEGDIRNLQSKSPWGGPSPGSSDPDH